MVKAVRYDEFRGIDVLRIDEVERPVPVDGQVAILHSVVLGTGLTALAIPRARRVGLTEQLAILVQEGLDAARRVPGQVRFRRVTRSFSPASRAHSRAIGVRDVGIRGRSIRGLEVAKGRGGVGGPGLILSPER